MNKVITKYKYKGNLPGPTYLHILVAYGNEVDNQPVADRSTIWGARSTKIFIRVKTKHSTKNQRQVCTVNPKKVTAMRSIIHTLRAKQQETQARAVKRWAHVKDKKIRGKQKDVWCTAPPCSLELPLLPRQRNIPTTAHPRSVPETGINVLRAQAQL